MDSRGRLHFRGARKHPLLDVNAAGLSGDDVFAHTVEVQRGSVVAVQRIATAASSVLTGGFKLSFKGLETGLIPVGASALDLKGELEKLESIGTINVTMRSVDVESVAKARARTSASFDAIEDELSLKFRQQEWDVTFLSHAGDQLSPSRVLRLRGIFHR